MVAVAVVGRAGKLTQRAIPEADHATLIASGICSQSGGVQGGEMAQYPRNDSRPAHMTDTPISDERQPWSPAFSPEDPPGAVTGRLVVKRSRCLGRTRRER